MKNEFILNKLKNCLQTKEYILNNNLNFHSVVEEGLKICLNEVDKIIIVKENVYYATKLYEFLRSFFDDEQLVLYTPEESLRHEAIIDSFDSKANSLKALNDILLSKPKVIITSGYGLLRHLPDKKYLLENIINLKIGDKIKQEDLIKRLDNLGYQRQLKADIPFTYAIRGLVVDGFFTNYENPIRIEFFDDEIEDMRFFDLENGKSINKIKEIKIGIAKDILFSPKDLEILKKESLKFEKETLELFQNVLNGSSLNKAYPLRAFLENKHLLDYLDDYKIYLSNYEAIKKNIDFIFKDNINYIQEMAEEKKLPLKFNVMSNLNQELQNKKIIKTKIYSNNIPDIENIDVPSSSIENTLKIISKDINDKKIIICLEEKELNRIKEVLKSLNYDFNVEQDELTYGFNLIQTTLTKGFEIKKDNLIFYSYKEIFNHQKNLGKYNKAYQDGSILNNYDELKIGDYVVHNNYGIGQYLGIHQKEVDGITKDYLLIAYKGNDQLSVPLNQFSLVRKYVSKEGYVPKLNKLGSKKWQETKKKAYENIEKMADQLIELYQIRQSKKGFKFIKDEELQKQFEQNFDFELTKDQIQAIKEVKSDMESDKIMDRLVCGDVGFGKTEVALRASMKACLSNKQVCYLCPTTILSLQHYNTFVRRFDDFGVKVALLNRYVSHKDQQETINKLKNGEINILIGTHRVLSNDVIFKDLGLLIIDEEQRFGVQHKEKIKLIKNDVDVLSLSATPIPRTLQMSLVGLRSLSSLNKPPLNRYPVQTYIVEKNDSLIKEAILKELSRKGQVFYLYNDTFRIYNIVLKLQKEIKDATIALAHGKMAKEEIEDIMSRFYYGEIDVLVCTTIIETGLDIPNANTIIIENAQNFGLSQLYQIKGRVGRSEQVAYAYFLIPKNKILNEEGTKRLEAIKEFSALGSGYKIALRDLTIRGAGDILGQTQSGFIENIGFDLYLNMLQETINIKKGIKIPNEETKNNLNIKVESYIPKEFSDNEFEKLDIYQSLTKIKNQKDLKIYLDKLEDEFGKLPKQIKNLLEQKLLEIFLNDGSLYSFKQIQNNFVVEISTKKSQNIDGIKFFSYCNNISKDLIISYKNNRITLKIKANKENLKKVIDIIEKLDNFKKESWL